MVIFDGVNDPFEANAGNLQPGGKFVDVPHADENQNRNTVPYAPYVIPRWTRFDQSTRTLTLHGALSVLFLDPEVDMSDMMVRVAYELDESIIARHYVIPDSKED